MTKTLTLATGTANYPIVIGTQLLGDISVLADRAPRRQVCIVTNQTVAPLYLEQVQKLFAGHPVDVVTLPDGEQYKNLATLELIYNELLAKHHHRTTTLVALGGGVVGDMTGFAAATFQRGVDFIQIPTTLLAQVDSSVGGKTGVNHPLGKNMIGAFHQPRAVIIDTDVLATLPPRELAAGMAEVIKYGLIADAAFFEWLEANMDALMALDAAALTYAIEQSCQTKADIVAQDEREAGVRAHLNLGHTFGHAIETEVGYGNWLHGEAVAAGMVMAMDLSCRLGWTTAADQQRLLDLLARAQLPTAPPVISSERYLQLMAADKKVLDGNIRLVLLRSLGQAVVTQDFPHPQLLATLQAFGG